MNVPHLLVGKLPCPGWSASGQGSGAGVAECDVAVGVGWARLHHKGVVAGLPWLPIELRADRPRGPVQELRRRHARVGNV
eukprot:3068858-Lingulodinium_polyedra.AAC.1